MEQPRASEIQSQISSYFIVHKRTEKFLCPIHTADADASTRLNCRVELLWRQSRRVWTNLPTAKSSRFVSAAWTHLSAVMTQFTISCVLMTSLSKKLEISIEIHVVKLLCSVSKSSTESVGSRRELVANCVHTADADDDATQLVSWVASAVCIGLFVKLIS